MEMVTKAEKEALEAKLAALIDNRPVISKRIAEARELGDLRENAEYHAAREDQGYQEAEIKRLEQRLRTVQVMDESHKSAGVVFLGATVKIEEIGSGDIELFKLVGEASGSHTGDVTEVTQNSPFGSALLKAEVGQVIDVRGPRGVKQFKILEII